MSHPNALPQTDRFDRSPKRLPGLDAIRGLAIALVMLRHAWPRFFGEAGVVGVAIFFTLSGYLITGILLRDADAPPGQLIWRFCRNRALRLLPPLLILLVIFCLVEQLTNRLADRDLIGNSLILGLTYTTDLPLRVHISPGVSHLWTLAVEQQFYLLWPLVLIGARRRLKLALAAIGVLVLATGAFTVMAFPTRGSLLYMLPTTWAVTLVIGAAAFVLRDASKSGNFPRLQSPDPESQGASRKTAAFSMSPGFAVALLLLICMFPDAKAHAGWFLVLGPIVAILTVSLIRASEKRHTAAAGWISPIRDLGTISYAAYLWNFPIVNWLHGPGLPIVSAWMGALSIPLTIIAAWLSWHLAEKHIARLKRDLDRPQVRPVPVRPPRLVIPAFEGLAKAA